MGVEVGEEEGAPFVECEFLGSLLGGGEFCEGIPGAFGEEGDEGLFFEWEVGFVEKGKDGVELRGQGEGFEKGWIAGMG